MSEALKIEIDRLRAENAELRAQTVDDRPWGAQIAAERAARIEAEEQLAVLRADLLLLRQALVKWQQGWAEIDSQEDDFMNASDQLVALIPDDCWGIGQTEGEPT